MFMILGIKMRRLLHMPGLRIVSEPQKCIGCLHCDKHCPTGLSVSKLFSEGEIKENECIQCGACVDHCPNAVLHYGMRAMREKV